MRKSFIGKLVFAHNTKIGQDVLLVPGRIEDGRVYSRHVFLFKPDGNVRISDNSESDPFFRLEVLAGVRLATEAEKTAWDAEERHIVTPTAYLLAALVAGK